MARTCPIVAASLASCASMTSGRSLSQTSWATSTSTPWATILLNPRTGLLFIDFAQLRPRLYLTGSAEILWIARRGGLSPERSGWCGSSSMSESVSSRGAHQLGVSKLFAESNQGGSWEEVAATLAARREGNRYRDYCVTRVQPESTNVTSFYLEPDDGGAVPCHQAGQFLPLELHLPGVDEPIRRTYTISNAPNGEYLRLSIKREGPGRPDLPPGLASNSFHDHVRVERIRGR